MKILFVTFYFPPDLCAGSFRAQPLAEALLREGGGRVSVDVLTTMPNRYHTHSREAAAWEEREGLTIRRFPLPSHRSGMVDQARAFLAFARAVRRETKGRKWDLVLATSSRLMTASLGAQVARRMHAPLYLDIRDLFTDTMGDLLAGSPLKSLLPAFRLIERRTFGAAARINLVSPGFLEHMHEVVPGHDFRLFSHGIDDDFLGIDFTKTQPRTGESLIVYAGNMGEGQGLHHVLPRAAKQLEGRARFRLVGDGGRRRQLEVALADAKVTNVEILDPVPRAKLNEHYREADILFTHLNDVPAFGKVLPSKIFEYAATQKPILAGVAGYAAEFLRREVAGAEIFAPCDAVGMVAIVNRLLTGKPTIDRTGFFGKFSRRNIMREMARDILELAKT